MHLCVPSSSCHASLKEAIKIGCVLFFFKNFLCFSLLVAKKEIFSQLNVVSNNSSTVLREKKTQTYSRHACFKSKVLTNTDFSLFSAISSFGNKPVCKCLFSTVWCINLFYFNQISCA